MLMYIIYQYLSPITKDVQNIVCQSREESKLLNTSDRVLHLCVYDFRTFHNNVDILLNPRPSLPPSMEASHSQYHEHLLSTTA
jgi:hypothetical protein